MIERTGRSALVLAAVSLVAASWAEPADAAGRRISGAQFAQSRGAVTSAVAPRRAATRRAIVRRSATESIGSLAPVRTTRATTRTTAAVGANRSVASARVARAPAVRGFALSAPAGFVNGYRINDLEFRTGDFFDRQQSIGTQ